LGVHLKRHVSGESSGERYYFSGASNVMPEKHIFTFFTKKNRRTLFNATVEFGVVTANVIH
jgi:hypothetical protein